MEFTPVRPKKFSFNCNLETVKIQSNGVVIDSVGTELETLRELFSSVYEKLHTKRKENFSTIGTSVFTTTAQDVADEQEAETLPNATLEHITEMNDQIWSHIYKNILLNPLVAQEAVGTNIQVTPSIVFYSDDISCSTNDKFIEAPLSPTQKLLLEPEYSVETILKNTDCVSIDFISNGLAEEHRSVLLKNGYSDKTLSGFSTDFTEREYLRDVNDDQSLYKDAPEVAGHIATINSSSSPIETSIDIISREEELSGRTGFLLYLLLNECVNALVISYSRMKTSLVTAIISNSPHLQCAGIPQIGKLLVYRNNSLDNTEEITHFENMFPERQNLDEIDKSKIKNWIGAPRHAVLDESTIEQGKRYEKLFELLSTKQANPYSVLYFLCAPFNTTNPKQRNIREIISYGDDLITHGLQADKNTHRTITTDFISNWTQKDIFEPK